MLHGGTIEKIKSIEAEVKSSFEYELYLMNIHIELTMFKVLTRFVMKKKLIFGKSESRQMAPSFLEISEYTDFQMHTF